MSLSRRQLLNTGAASGAGLVAGSALLGPAAFADRGKGHGHGHSRKDHPLFPPLQAEDGALLALPRGFGYTVVAASQSDAQTTHEGRQRHALPPRRHPRRGHQGRLPAGAEPRGLTAVRRQHPGRPADRGHRVRRGVHRRRRRVHRHRRHLLRRARHGVRRPVRHAEQLRRRAEPLGHLADLRGVRDQGRRRRRCGHRPAGPRLRLRGLPRRRLEAVAAADQGLGPRPARGRRRRAEPPPRLPHRGRQRADRPALPVVRAPRMPQPYIAEHLADDAGRLEAMAVLAPDGSVLPDLAYVTAAQIGRPFRCSGRPCRTGTPAPPRRASSSTTARSPAPRSSRAPGATTRASTSWPASPSPRDLPADATQHDGQLWFYRYSDGP